MSGVGGGGVHLSQKAFLKKCVLKTTLLKLVIIYRLAWRPAFSDKEPRDHRKCRKRSPCRRPSASHSWRVNDTRERQPGTMFVSLFPPRPSIPTSPHGRHSHFPRSSPDRDTLPVFSMPIGAAATEPIGAALCVCRRQRAVRWLCWPLLL